MRYLLLSLVFVLQINSVAGYNVPVLPKICMQETLTSENSDSNAYSCIDRGFTGHQHLDVFNLINMGGRVYDPVVQQFLSPDPYVQLPDNTQSLNRYTYCMNSPLMYVDPDGEFFIFDSYIVGFFHGLFSKGSNRWENAVDEARQRAYQDFKIWGGLFTSDKNKNWLGQTWEVISRFTWQLPQTIGGFLTSHSFNTIGIKGGVESVEYKYGATVLQTRKSMGAVTLSSFIVGGSSIEADPTNKWFQHEYGHYLQSQLIGPFYLPTYGLTSIISAGLKDGRHDNLLIEQDANIRAFKYFSKYERGFNWVDEYEKYQTHWNSDFNPINGYDWNNNTAENRNTLSAINPYVAITGSTLQLTVRILMKLLKIE